MIAVIKFHSHDEWLGRLSRAASAEALGQVMTDWFAGLKDSSQPSGSLGFEFYMQARDWQSAKGSLERSYGRSSGVHRNLVEMLSAAIMQKKLLAMAP